MTKRSFSECQENDNEQGIQNKKVFSTDVKSEKRQDQIEEGLIENDQDSMSEQDIKVPRYEEGADGLIRVLPYHFTHSTWAKRRWVGLSLEQVYLREFLEYPPAYYRAAILAGKITVDHKQITSDYRVKEGDLLLHSLHRHEPPVLARPPIQKLYEDDSMLVIDKPASYQVHPTGRFFYNTIIERLKHDYGYPFLGICNRLDRLVSGLMILGKTKEKAQQLAMQMKNRTVQKEYIATVEGEFKFQQTMRCTVDDVGVDVITILNQTTIRCDAPVGIINNKLSIYSVFGSDAKPSTTVFERVSYCPTSNTSIVRCVPTTGRTHQLRVHLRYLGFPICNDVLYNNSLWKSVIRQNPDKSIAEISFIVAEQLLGLVKNNAEKKFATVKNEQLDSTSDDLSLKEDLCNELEDVMHMRYSAMEQHDYATSLCYQCVHPAKNPRPESLFICLHAYKYCLLESGQEFQTALPHWAA